MSVLDPTYTFSVSKRQTAAGTADMMSHVFESYFTNVEGATLQAHMSEALLKTLVHYGPIALAEPDNYDARANLMWCGSRAINGLLDSGARWRGACIPWSMNSRRSMTLRTARAWLF